MLGLKRVLFEKIVLEGQFESHVRSWMGDAGTAFLQYSGSGDQGLWSTRSAQVADDEGHGYYLAALQSHEV